MFDLFAKKKGKPGFVGITATGDKISIAHLIQENDTPVLHFCKQFPATTDKERADILDQQVKKLGLEGTNTNFVLSSADYKLFLVEAPRVESQEMESAVKWKIKDMIDSPVEELAVTLFPVPEDAYRNQNDMVYAVAARKSKIRQVVELVTDSGLNLKAIDIPELALMNISGYFSDDSNGLAFIDLHSAGSTLNLCKDGMIYLTRHLNTHFDQEVINSTEWETVRERLVLEIQRSLDYYESQMGQAPISMILVAPRENYAGSLVSPLNDTMSAQVNGLDMAGEFGDAEQYPVELLQSCILAIGGAMRIEQVAA